MANRDQYGRGRDSERSGDGPGEWEGDGEEKCGGPTTEERLSGQWGRERQGGQYGGGDGRRPVGSGAQGSQYGGSWGGYGGGATAGGDWSRGGPYGEQGVPDRDRRPRPEGLAEVPHARRIGDR